MASAKIFALLVIGAILSDSQVAAGVLEEEPDKPPTIEELTQALTGLKSDTKGIFTELGRTNTFCQVGSGLVKKIRDEEAPKIRLVNEQQSSIIGSFKTQIADLLHRADKAAGDIKEADSQADRADSLIDNLKKRVGNMESNDLKQDNLADAIVTKMDDAKRNFLEDARTTVAKLDNRLNILSSDVSQVDTYNNGKKCEYGTSCVSVGAPANVTFDVNFTGSEGPEVCTAVIGWSAHIPTQAPTYGTSKVKPTSIEFQASTQSVTNDGFTISLEGEPNGELLKDVYVRWMACQNMAQTPPENVCSGRADIVFMLDFSESLDPVEFIKILEFVASIVSNLEVGQNKVRVGVMKFSSRERINSEISLNEFDDMADLLSEINRISNDTKGETFTDVALVFLRDTMFNTTNGDRPDIPNIGIVITDGKSNNSTLTAMQAETTRAENITLLAVGVGNRVNQMELEDIASGPDDTNVFNVASVSVLDTIKSDLQEQICSEF